MEVIPTSDGFWILKDPIDFGSVSHIYSMQPGRAVKAPRAQSDASIVEIFERELQIYEWLGDHPRILRCFGRAPSIEMVDGGIVLEMHLNRSIELYLREFGSSEKQRLRWCTQVAEALAFIHSHGVIHCDIHRANVLLDNNLECKLCDFAGASIGGSRALIEPRPNHRSPYFNAELPSKQYDLFSMGSLTFSVMADSEPYDNLEAEEIKQRFAAKHWPSAEAINDAKLQAVIHSCWNGDITSAERLRQCLEGVQIGANTR